MPAYVIVQGTVFEPKLFERYAVESREGIRAHGGRVIARGAPSALSATVEDGFTAVIEFPDTAAARRWHDSREYQLLVPLRDTTSRMRLTLVDGFTHT